MVLVMRKPDNKIEIRKIRTLLVETGMVFVFKFINFKER